MPYARGMIKDVLGHLPPLDRLTPSVRLTRLSASN